MTRIAVSTRAYFRPAEIPVASHILNIFDGTAVVLGQVREGTPVADKPFLIWDEAWGGGLDRVVSAALGAAAYPRTRSLRVPQGARRRAMAAFLREHGVQAVLCEFGSNAVYVSPVAQELGLPVFCFFRGLDVGAYLSRKSRVEAYKRMMPRLTGIFAVSQFLVDELARRGITHPNTHVLPSGADTGWFTPGPKTPGLCLAVGRFIEKKRPDITLRAFARAARNHADARLVMLGSGPMLDPCRALATELGVDDKVSLPGALPNETVQEAMAKAQIFLQHSVVGSDGNTEGLPISIQEAMSSGAVVVSTRHAGIAEAVTEGETGFLVDEHDEDAFAARIKDLLDGRYDCAAMGKRARDVAIARFDRWDMMARVEAEIRRAVDG